MTAPELSRRRADMLREQGRPWAPSHTVRTYGLIRDKGLEALVVSSSFDSVFHFELANRLGYRVLMLAEYDVTKVPGAADRLREKLLLAGGRL